MVKEENTGISKERFAVLQSRYVEFISRLDDVTKEPFKVYDPLPQKARDEIALIREVSADLQNHKDEELKKAAQAAQEAEEKAKEAAKEQSEEEKPETEKEN